MNINFEEIEKMREELIEYSDLEGTELGESCARLCAMSHYSDYVSESFYAAVIEEMKNQLAMFKRETNIVETTETYTRKVVDLEWK
jgi:hypothetical protein